MEPPSYEEANPHLAAQGTERFTYPPPPAYDASLASPSTPPPTYGEAVTIRPDAFPVLLLPSVPSVVIPPSRNTGVTVHPPIQVSVTQPGRVRQTQPAAVVTQPRPVPVAVTRLGDSPGLIRCPHCQNRVTTKVKYVPGKAAWCMCVLLSLLGLVCFCAIPLMIRDLQDAHHSCPLCENTVHIYTR